jgi:hypothetical protein
MAIEKPLVTVENYFVSYIDHRSWFVAGFSAHFIKKNGKGNHVSVSFAVQILASQGCVQIQPVASRLKIQLGQTPYIVYARTILAGTQQVITRNINCTNQTVSGTAVYHSAISISER